MKKIFFFFFITLGGIVSNAQSVKPFTNGDNVAFVGNSITDGGHYHSYIWLYYMTRFPNQRITINNCGIGGDVAENIYQRLDADILNRKPNVIVLTFGMNDTGYFDFLKKEADSIAKQRIAESKASYEKIEQRLQHQPSIRKIIMTSSPYDETSKFTTNNIFPGKGKAMLAIANFQEASAKKNGWDFVDINRPMTKINMEQQQYDSAFTLCGTDRIHPGNDGHLVMASIFLTAQGLAGKPVAIVDINARNNQIIKTENCSVTHIQNDNAGITFDYLAKSLPYPIDTIPRGWMEKSRQSDALKVYPFTKKFNQEILAVKNLSKEKYQLIIDGHEIGILSAKELADGINLAEQTRTPQYQQAIAVRELNEERWEIERRFRQNAYVEFNLLAKKGLFMKDNLEALDTVMKYAQTDWAIGGNKDNYMKSRFPAIRDVWEKEMGILIDKIYMINKPVSHKVILKALN